MQLSEMEQRVRRMHAAMANLHSENIEALKAQKGVEGYPYFTHLDFNEGASDDEMQNSVYTLISNIASLKDHLKAWCKSHGVEFLGDKLIDANENVSIIHDLWNIDKHYELSRPPRSGFTPKVVNIKRVMVLAPASNSSASFTFDPVSGNVKTQGGAGLAISADVIDENGIEKGHFKVICKNATKAWGQALCDAGVLL